MGKIIATDEFLCKDVNPYLFQTKRKYQHIILLLSLLPPLPVPYYRSTHLSINPPRMLQRRNKITNC